ncbi:LapA family protein [Piscinibacter sp.]|jgi:uncharacterized integral membrane protein|uniref:LapA family protein n=1 Tax=Piscinibacter sp. TaxID=1903157 RepID=UPI002F4023EE
MRLRTLFLFLVLVLIGLFALLNWQAFTAPTALSIGFRTLEAPIGLVMLGVCFVIAAMCLAVVIYVQGVALLDARRQAKELQAQRDLAERAEASRVTELRNFFNAELLAVTRATTELRLGVLSRLDQMEQRSQKALQETSNTLAAHIGELEDRLDHAHVPLPLEAPERPRGEAGTAAR